MDLGNALRNERKTAELLPLESNFYEQVGLHIASLEMEFSKVGDHFSVEAQIIEDELKAAKKSIAKLIDIRMRKISKRALRRASSPSGKDSPDGMTPEEAEIYSQVLSAVARGRESIFTRLASQDRQNTERPLTGKMDIAQEYAAVRLLDSVPMFMGVDGRRYLLNRGDVVMLPKVHVRNLCNKNLAQEVSLR